MAQPDDMARQLDRWLQTERSARRTWCWRTNNCCHFAGRWVRHATGREVLGTAADVPGPNTARQRTGMAFAAIVSRHVMSKELPAGEAQIGDLVLYPTAWGGVGAALGICGGRVAWALDVDGRPCTVEMADAQCCWPLWRIDEAVSRVVA